MLKQSIEEYKEISNLARNASDAVTRYTTATFSISSGALIAILKFGGDETIGPLAIFFVATVTCYIHRIINYKCDSHNRLVAYKSIISSEMLFKGDEDDKKKYPKDRVNGATNENEDQYVAFAFCIGQMNEVKGHGMLNMSIFRKYHFFSSIPVSQPPIISRDINGFSYYPDELQREKYVAEGYNPRKVKIKDFCDGSSREIDNSKIPVEEIWRRIKILFLSQKRSSDQTWNFPIYIGKMLLFLVFCQIFAAGALLVSEYCSIREAVEDVLWIDRASIIACLPLSLWLVIIMWKNGTFLYELMHGYKTIDKYIRKLMPFRLMYIAEMTQGDRPYLIESYEAISKK